MNDGLETAVGDAEPLTALLQEKGALVVDRVFTGQLPVDASLGDVELEACTLRACRWTEHQLQGATFAECDFTGCNISGVSVRGVSFRECTLTGTKALGVDWTAAAVSGLAPVPMRWRDCVLDYSTLSMLDLAGWSFTGCSLREVHLAGAGLRRVELVGCDLSGATFGECDLRGARMIDCVGVELDVRDNRVSGLEVSAGTAGDLLAPLGVVVC
ncbi:MAG: pentapeptide repeat-containing protein [Actinobacteria bacterium]|nr:pentapeptide repeat-containing protein [Actinomycetota bacterium]